MGFVRHMRRNGECLPMNCNVCVCGGGDFHYHLISLMGLALSFRTLNAFFSS